MHPQLEQLTEILRRRTCLVGIGNPLRSDDRVGVYLVEQTQASLPLGKLETLNAEDILESYVFQLAESACENVVLVDALEAGAEPGSLFLGVLDDLEDLPADCSTHRLCLGLAGRLLERQGKRVFILGITPENIDFGTSMSSPVKATADWLVHLIVSLSSEKGASDAT